MNVCTAQFWEIGRPSFQGVGTDALINRRKRTNRCRGAFVHSAETGHTSSAQGLQYKHAHHTAMNGNNNQIQYQMI